MIGDHCIFFLLSFLGNCINIFSDESATTSSDTFYFVQNGTNQYCVNETNLVYAMNGNVSITGTFRNCLNNIVDGLVYPGWVCGQPLNISTQVMMNNLVSVDEITDAVTFDIFLTLQWVDCRFDMPAFWARTDEDVQLLGINMFPALTTPLVNGNQLGIWTPSIVFPEAINYQVNNAFIRLFPGGIIQWQQHAVLTLIQSSFTYYTFPHGTHQILLRYYPFAQGNQLINLQLMPCTSTTNTSSCNFGTNNPLAVLFVGYNDKYSFSQSSIWTFDNISGSIGTTQLSSGYQARSTASIKASITRQSKGLVLRLAMPILLLVTLGAVTFWASFETRMDTTVTLLVAVSALYVVVFENIPMIGYLTAFDQYALFMFFLLFSACVLHQFTIQALSSELEKEWPLRKIYIRVLELLGRVAIIPLSTGIYLASFPAAMSAIQFIFMSFGLACFALFALARESGGLYVMFGRAIQEIAGKLDRLDDVSMLEIVVYNLYKYKVFSRSMSHHVMQRKKALQAHQDQLDLQAADIQPNSANDASIPDDASGKISSGTETRHGEDADSDDET